MILRAIQMENFRQFMGEQRFPLDVASDKVVTLLFGGNGAGKTTLLNAFTWCLYGDLSHDMEHPERLVTDLVWQSASFGEDVRVSVEVEFEHEGDYYRAQRAAKIRKDEGARRAPSADLKLWVTQNGQNKAVDAPQQKMESILPQHLSRFFFFNGERIEKLVEAQAYAEVKKDINSLLGLEQVERALQHLPKLERKLGAELRKHGGAQAAELQEKIEANEGKLELARAERDKVRDGLATITEEHAKVRELLLQHSTAGPLQAQRNQAEEQLKKARSDLNKHQLAYQHQVGTRGYLAFIGSLSMQAADLAAGLHERGSLPAPLKRDFVDSLIEDARCICGTELGPGTAALRHVEEWRARAGLAEVEAAWQRLDGEVKRVGEARSQLRSRLQELSADLQNDRDTITRWEGQLADLEEKVKKIPVEEVARLESRREQLQAKMNEANQKIGAIDSSIAVLQAEILTLRNGLKAAEISDAVAQKARRRVDLVSSVNNALREILSIRSADMQARLDAKVKEVFSQITVKPYYPELTDDFELGLYQQHSDGTVLPVPKSTGENQILSLSFVAAVSQLAREVAQGRDESSDSGEYPIVMDAAFGSLDENYKRDVAFALARLAPQMIVMVSKGQGQGEVFDQLRPHCSNLGVIVGHMTSTSSKSEDIELGGFEYPYIDAGADKDWTELMEVPL